MSSAKEILYIAQDSESAQYRYRCLNVAQAIENSHKYFVKIFLKDKIGDAEQRLSEASLVVIERQTAKDGVILDFIKKAHGQNVKVLLDIDDLVFDYRDLLTLMRSTNSKNVFYWVGYFWGIRRIAKKVDGFIVTNDFLGKKIQRTFRRPYKVIFNSLNREQIEKSKEYLKKKSSGFRIGYFSGSPTHTKDFRMVEPELLRFLDKHKEVKLDVVGYMEFSSQAAGYIKSGRIKIHKLVSYLEMLEMMAEVNVNIAPLLINDFTNCKSELKFFEAAAVETTTIASPSFTFKNAISDGKNGFLAEPGEWYSKLEYLYEHPEENKKMAKAARNYALKHYAGEEFLKQIEEAYDYFAK
ncbi:glycosyltransferase [Candidatus Saccharibacteria bacterium]|nr:glycosyltransferase [Candidatus Saccharibacteria bacterium]